MRIALSNNLKFTALGAVIALALAAGCHSNTTPQPVDPAAANTAPAPAAPPATVAQEQATAAAPAPAPILPRSITVAGGTSVVVRITQTLSAHNNNVGDGFTGVLVEPVTSGNMVIFRRGTSVSGTVVAAKGQGRFKGAGALGIELTAIGNVSVATTEYEEAVKGKGKRTATMIGGGAGLGALIGGLAGGGKGALIGAGAGAAAGTGGAAFTGNKDVVIPSESVITFRTRGPFTVRM